MKIVADENIPFVRETFGPLGEVVTCGGREMSAGLLADADILLVRSVTKVNADLLGDSPVRFVGTATIGTDHIDQEYLASRQIRFSSAAGSNANSVAEYVLTALTVLAEKHGWDLDGKTLGIVGVGNIGSILERKCRVLGLTPLPNDPPLQRESGDRRYVSLDEALAADFVTCHVPLTRTGSDATYHLLDEARLRQMGSQAVLINSSRGAVVDNAALKKVLNEGHLAATALDVWEGEPEIDVELLERVSLGSPHIAGYSFDGKVNGTVQLYEAVCAMLGQPARVTAADLLPEPPVPEIELAPTTGSDQNLIGQALTTIYPIERDDANLRGLLELPPEQRGGHFDHLRKTYPTRREAHNSTVTLTAAMPSLAAKLQALGFKVAPE